MKTNITTRHSNIELLRIVSMLLIVCHHYVMHGVMGYFSSSPFSVWANGTILNKTFSLVFIPGGDICVSIFLLLLVFFKSRNPERQLRKFPLLR